MRRIKQIQRCAGDVLHLDEFVVVRDGMVMDFVDDGGANARTAVDRAEGVLDLCRKLFLAGAIHVATKGNAKRSCAKLHAMGVAREIRSPGLATEQVHLLAAGIEREAGTAWIEIRFGEIHVTAGLDRRAIRNAKFAWLPGV